MISLAPCLESFTNCQVGGEGIKVGREGERKVESEERREERRQEERVERWRERKRVGTWNGGRKKRMNGEK